MKTHVPPLLVGIVFDIQRAAMHDGPGIRTTVFLKGCPLRCQWCHNPESQTCAPETGQGGKTYGRSMSVEEVMAVVRRDLPFYRASGGGLTLSGGEPTFQADFCIALLRAAQAEGIHTCLDTSGFFSAAIRERVRPWVDLFLFDFKATGEDLHRHLTHVPTSPIQENLEALLALGAAIWLRCPMIPGVNDQPAHLHAIAALSRKHRGIRRVDILLYHRTGVGKWHDLGIEPLDGNVPEPDEETKHSWLSQLESEGALDVHCG